MNRGSGRLKPGLLLALLLSAFFLSISAAIQPSPSTPAASAPWFATHRSLHQIDPNTHALLHSIPLPAEATAVVVDPDTYAVFVLSHKHLFKFDAATSLVFDIDLKALAPGLDDPDGLLLSPEDQSLWIRGKKQFLKLRLTGEHVLTLDAQARLRDAALDFHGRLWALTHKTLTRYTPTGTPEANLPLTEALEASRRLAVDALGGRLWLAGEDHLVQIDAATLTSPARHIALPEDMEEIEHLALDPVSGTLWVAGEDGALAVDRAGQVVARLDLDTHGLAEIEALAFDPETNSLWLGGHKTLAHFSRTGEFLGRMAIDKELEALGVAVPAIAPTLALVTPAKDSLTNDARPAIRFTLGATCNRRPCDLGSAYLQGLSLDVTLNGQAVGSQFTLNGAQASYTPASRLPEGINTFTATAIDTFGHRSELVSGQFAIDTVPPTIMMTAPQAPLTREASQTLRGTLSESALLTLNGALLATEADNSFTQPLTLVEGENRYDLVAQDAAGNIARRTLILTLDTLPPAAVKRDAVTLGTIENGQITVTGGTASAEAQATVTATNASRGASVTGGVNAAGAFELRIDAQPGDTLALSVTDPAGNTSPVIEIVLPGGPGELPPDPATVAPPVDRTVATTTYTATAFLYTGSHPIQTGVAQGTIEPRRAAVLRGKVSARDGSPLSGVTITLHHHPEFGETRTRADGLFDLAVNGGGYLIINYEKAGFLPVQRRVRVPWQDYVVVPNVVMIPLDAQATVVDLDPATPMQVARGSVVSDQDGTRQAMLLFPQGTNATAVLPDGAKKTLTTLTVRATEYTVGENGPLAMPGELPATSGYTYAVEYSIDEAISIGAKTVRFSQPVYQYLDNFLSFPVGTIVPLAFYDRDRAAWVPSPNGRIVRILGITNGVVDLDVSGNGTAADEAALASMNITLAERAQLASLYPAGKSLWRAPIPHFSAWDSNWGIGPPPGAAAPNLPDPNEDPQDDPDCQSGSVIECQNQAVGENIPIVGTGFSLVYKSNRTPGYKAGNYSISIPLSGSTMGPGVKRIDLEVRVGGRLFTQSFSTEPNQLFTFVWDGRDAYGRVLQGAQPMSIRVGYVYNAVYRSPAELSQSFGYNGAGAISSNEGRTEITLWQERRRSIGSWAAISMGLGGWTLNVHHAYDPNARALYLGDGRTRRADQIPNFVETFAGGGINTTGNGDGGPATEAKTFSPHGIAVGADGTVYFSDAASIRQVDSNGIISTLATLPASPSGIDVADDGTVFAAETNGSPVPVISRIGPDGTRSVIAGGSPYSTADGIPATQAYFNATDVKAGSDGSLYLADPITRRVRKVDPSSLIATLASGRFVRQVDLDSAGNIYWLDHYAGTVNRIGSDGKNQIVAGIYVGSGSSGSSVFDGAIATQVYLGSSYSLAVAPDGTFYIGQNGRVLQVKDGLFGTYATGTARASGLALGHDGDLYVADSLGGRVRRVRSALPKFSASDISIASEDGNEIYHFDAFGRHLRTLDAYTGAVRLLFSYGNDGLVTQVRDGDGNATRIERDTNGNPTAIVGPDGQRTLLTIDTTGYLQSVTNPAGETVAMTYMQDGLMTSFTNGRGQASMMSYDEFGRLVWDENAAGGSWQLARMEIPDGHEVSMRSALGRTTVYRTETLNSGIVQRTNTFPDETRRITATNLYGTATVTHPNGTVVTLTDNPDPRFRLQSPIQSGTIRLPSGLTLTQATNRTVALETPGVLLSLLTETTQKTVNGRTATNVYIAATHEH